MEIERSLIALQKLSLHAPNETSEEYIWCAQTQHFMVTMVTVKAKVHMFVQECQDVMHLSTVAGWLVREARSSSINLLSTTD